MPLKDFITGKTNRIVVGATTGVGLILITSAALFSSKPLPVLKVENPNTGASLFEVSDHGAIGVNGSFGSAGECLKSGGSSGSVMAFGSCGGGTGGSSPEVGTSSFSGATLRLSDARYVKKQGDTMTGSLNVRATLSGQTLVITGNGSFTGKLVVAQTVSGAALEVLGTASGLNVFSTKSVTGTHLYAVTTFAGAGLASCSNATTSKLLYNSVSKQFSCGTDTDTNTTYTAGQGLTLTSTSFSLSARHSGSTIQASSVLASSGSVNWEGTASGRLLTISGQATFSGGILSRRAISGAALEVLGTASGLNIYATNALTGTNLYVATTFYGAGLGDCDTAGTSKLMWSAETKQFSCGTDQTSAGGGLAFSAAEGIYVNQKGDTMTGQLVIALTAGNIGLNVKAGMSGNFLTVARGANFAMSGVLITNTGTTVFNEQSRNVDFRIEGDTNANAFYVDASTDRIGVNKNNPKATLDVLGAISGSSLRVANLNRAGAVIYSAGPTSDLAQTALGTTGTVLVSQGASAPIWKADGIGPVFIKASTLSTGRMGNDVRPGYGCDIDTGRFGEFGLTLVEPPYGSSVIVNVKRNGTSIFSTKPKVEPRKWSNTGAAVFSTTSFTGGSVLTAEIDQIGSTAAGSGLTLMLWCSKKP